MLSSLVKETRGERQGNSGCWVEPAVISESMIVCTCAVKGEFVRYDRDAIDRILEGTVITKGTGFPEPDSVSETKIQSA